MEILLSKSQIEFMGAPEEYTLFCGGLGSGKTHGGAVWAIHMALTYPGTKGLITANSYSQLRKATLAKLFELLTEYGIEFKYKSQEGIIQIGESIIYAISMEKYDLLRGIEIGWCWSDECAFYKAEAFNVLIGRIRDTKGPCQWKGTTTPNGFNWLYETFVEKPFKSSKIIRSRTADNLANLKGSYVDDLKSQYDTRLAKQELDGQFVNLNSGKVYYNFDRAINCKKVDDTHAAIFIGLDFNVHPLCGVIGYIHGNTIVISQEIYLENSNTFDAAKEIVSRFPHRYVRIVCDETGNRRKTSSNTTDHEIMRRANLEVMPFKNPHVKDRYNNLNRLFEQKRIIIDPSCKMLIKDLEQLVYDNKDEMLSHISDALGYLAWYAFPLKKPKRESKITYR